MLSNSKQQKRLDAPGELVADGDSVGGVMAISPELKRSHTHRNKPTLPN